MGAASDDVDETDQPVRGRGGGGLNEALLAKAAEAKLLRTGRVRADTTVSRRTWPIRRTRDRLRKAAGKLVRAARAVQAAGGAPDTAMTDRRGRRRGGCGRSPPSWTAGTGGTGTGPVGSHAPADDAAAAN